MNVIVAKHGRDIQRSDTILVDNTLFTVLQRHIPVDSCDHDSCVFLGIADSISELVLFECLPDDTVIVVLL